MTATDVALKRSCRSVTPEEVQHYVECGWVKLRSFIDPDLVRTLLDIAVELMGADGDSNGPPRGGLSYFNPVNGGGLKHPVLRSLIDEAGKSAKLLMHRKSGLGVRYYHDIFIPKLPSSRPSKHGGNGVTDFHQDFISHGVDRSGGMTFWIPLEAYGPVHGTMSFLSGSHTAGVLGDFQTYGDGDLLDVFPELRDFHQMSEPMSYEVGDVTVHSDMIVHGADANMSDKPRWAYTIFTKPADVCWTGWPCPNFDSSQMKPWQAFDEVQMPILA